MEKKDNIESVIKSIELKLDNPLSRIDIGGLSSAQTDELAKLDIVYLEGKSDNTGSVFDYTNILYQHKSECYIHMKKFSAIQYDATFLFLPSQLDEVKFLITRLKKII